MENVVRGIELLQRAVKMRDIIDSTSKLQSKLQSQNYPKRRRKGILGRRHKNRNKIMPKNNILDTFIQVISNYNAKSNIEVEKKESFRHSIFETHDLIIGRVDIPKGINQKDVRMFLGASSAIITFNESRYVILLPQEIKKEEVTAKIREGVLEFKAPKLNMNEMSEINIHL